MPEPIVIILWLVVIGIGLPFLVGAVGDLLERIRMR